MPHGVLLAIIAGLLWSGIGVIMSMLARRGIPYTAMTAPSMAFSATAAWLFVADHSLLLSGNIARLGPLTIIMVASGVLSGLGINAISAGMRRGHHAAVWTIGQSALVVPFLAGVLLFGDRAPLLKCAGVVSVLVSVAAFGLGGAVPQAPGRTYTRGAWFAFAVTALLCMGVHQVLSIVPSYWRGWEDSAHLRIPLVMSGSAITHAALCMVNRVRVQFSILKWAIGMCVIILPSLVCIYRAMDLLSAHNLTAIVYPVAVGTCVVSFALYSALIVREHIDRYRAIGIVCGLAGIVLLSV
jgi:drug/metabolite transporter (DMT)-like permease